MAEENEVILAWGDAQGKGRTTLAQLKKWINSPEENAEKIADFVYWRLYERYIRPFEELNTNADYGQEFEDIDDKDKKTTQQQCKLRIGFATMASICLLIETLEAFIKGKERFYGRKSKKREKDDIEKNAFVDFFTEHKDRFNIHQNFGHIFFDNIRCGILHQGETYKGWLIRTQGSAINEATKIINAKEFIKIMKEILQEYSDEIIASDFLPGSKGDLCITKIRFIIKHTKQQLKIK